MATKRSLVEKLGLKEGYRIAIIDSPEDYRKTLGELPLGVSIARDLDGAFDLIQFFARSRKELENRFARLQESLSPKGMLWVSWPKVSSKNKGDLNEDAIRAVGLRHDLVDVKVISVNYIWSGLKFVHRCHDPK